MVRLFIKYKSFLYNIIKIENNPKILKWNSNKIYLKDLCNLGLNCVQTFWINKKDKKDDKIINYIDIIHNFLDNNQINECVIKPSISANAMDTYVYKREEHRNDNNNQETENSIIKKGIITSKQILNKVLNRIVLHSHIMIQPVIKEIYENGEISLIFFNNKFSHSVKKIPKQGEFRVQEDFGGDYCEYKPSKTIVNEGKVFVNALIESIFPDIKEILYVRVDGIIVNNHFQLMELEVLEPSLFISESSKYTFIEAILSKLS